MELRSPSAVIKYHRLGGLNNRTVLALTSGDWKSEVNMPTVLVSPEASLLGVQTAVFLCILGWSYRASCIPGMSSSLYKNISPAGLEPNPNSLMFTLLPL